MSNKIKCRWIVGLAGPNFKKSKGQLEDLSSADAKKYTTAGVVEIVEKRTTKKNVVTRKATSKTKTQKS